jgi:uncharacterized protein YfaS (alpha-2-macroglobulin family)
MKIYPEISLRQCLSLILIAAFLLSACQPALPGPDAGPTPTMTTTAPDSSLKSIDPGTPLPPRIIDRQPQPGQELTLDGEIVLTFDQPMDAAQTAAAWTFRPAGGQPLAGQISWPSPRAMHFKPEQPLQMSSLYIASLESQATSARGVALPEALELQFITVGDLQVSQVFPLDGSQDVANTTVVTVIFNRPVTPLVMSEQHAALPSPIQISPQIAGKGEWINTSVYAFRPDQPWKGSTTYTVSVAAGLEDALQETRLAEEYRWQFTTTAPSIANFELSGGYTNPEDKLHNVLLDSAFTIRFNQPMNPANSLAALSLTSQPGGAVQLETKWNEAFTTLVITPTQRLVLETEYTLKLGANAQAADGGRLKEGLTWNFRTIPKPAILSTVPADGSEQTYFSSELRIQFASPMNIETVKERIRITPQPPDELTWWYNDWDWSIVAFGLQPSTSYQVRLLAGMQDIYGNAIQDDQTIRFTTTAYEPYATLRMPYETPLFRASQPQEFYAQYLNIETLSLKLYQLDQALFADLLSGKKSSYDYKPDEKLLVWETNLNNGAPLNQRVIQKFTMTIDGGLLPPGFYFLGLDSPKIRHSRTWVENRLFIVANANLTFKTTADEALAWLTDLESGQPLTGAALTVYDQNFQPIGEGQTASDGLLTLKVKPPEEPYEARFALVDDGETFAFASSQWGSGVSLWNYGIWGSYYTPPNQPLAYVYTERPIYRPGQPVYFKGIVRLDDDLRYSLPDAKNVRIKISNYQELVFDEEFPLTDLGSFSGQFNLDSETDLGYYFLEVSLPERDGVIGSVTFNVAEYSRPEFQVSVSANPADLLYGQSFSAQVQADYYSGGGVSNAEVKWTLTAAPFEFTPPDEYLGYSFSDQEQEFYGSGYPNEFGSYQTSEVIAEGEGVTNELGRFSIRLPVELSDPQISRQLVFEATVTDLSKNAVSGRTTVIAHRSQVYPGIRSTAYIAKAGQEQTFEMVALDWSGAPRQQQSLKVEIFERKWYSVQEQDPSGRISWKSTVEELLVQTFEDILTDQRGKASVQFTPPKGGIYRGRVTALDERGNAGKASTFLWVAGDEFIPWPQTNDYSFELITDRKRYTPGESAEILIASPFSGSAYALVTVERGRIHYQDVIQLESNSVVYKLPITANMAPNAYISVLIIKGVDEDNPTPKFRMGIAEIGVNLEQQTLTVQLIPDREQAGPGELVRYTVRTLDSNGSPVSAEVSLSLSDLATLSLMPPNSQPILDYFYSKRGLGVWTSVPLSLSIDQFNAEIAESVAEGMAAGSGGAKGVGDLGVVEVRQDFPDTAFWDAHVLTGPNGEASVTVQLPDNLTTWRMEARAFTADKFQVGQTRVDIVSTRPLLVRPQTPRFLVVGDQVTLGTAVHNNTNQAFSVEVSLEAQGLDLRDSLSQTIQLAANGKAYVIWQAVVQPTAERVDLIFKASGGGYQDASRPPAGTLDNQGLPVYRYEARESVGTSGQMLEGGLRLEAISLPGAYEVSEGHLTIQVSPSLASGMTASLEYLEHFPYECTEQTISRFLPNVISSHALRAAGLSDPALESNLKDNVQTALQRLGRWQNADGGWGWWAQEKSDPLTSAYAVLGLIEAREAGYTINENVVKRALTYLSRQVTRLERLDAPWKINRQAFILYVLARAEKPDVSNTVKLFEQWQGLAIYSRALLAQTLHIIDANDPRLKTLLSDLSSTAIYSASGTHWEEPAEDRWNWNTDTRTTAIVLSALSQLDPENPLNANAVRWLMSTRSSGHWLGTQETAWSLMALTNWMVASGELQANYEYVIELNGQRLGSGEANRQTLRETTILKIDVADLLSQEANRLAFARSDGPGNLYYTAHLELSLPVEQIQPLDQGMVVSRSYYRLDDLNTPVIEAQQGDLLLARLTLVTPHARHFVLVNDPLPAGLEAVDQALSVSPQSIEVPQEYSWDELWWRGWGWWWFSHVQMRDEKVTLSASYLPAGTYVYTYMVRAASVGVFRVIPPTAQEFYFPEVYGRGPGSLFSVTP